MKNNARLIYWDSCIFLSHINSEPEREIIIESLWDELEKEQGHVITSTVAIVEVSHGSCEKSSGRLDSSIESAIDNIWCDPLISIVELNQPIAELARNLIRDAIQKGWNLKSKDAIHLASASWIDRNISHLDEFHTFDETLDKYGPILGFQIKRPHVDQLKLI